MESRKQHLHYFHLKSIDIVGPQNQRLVGPSYQIALESLCALLSDDQNVLPNTLTLYHLEHGMMFYKSHLYHVLPLEYQENQRTSYLFPDHLHHLQKTNGMFGYHLG